MYTLAPCRAGFTLLEVLVALFLTVIALGALEGASVVTLRRLAENRREETAATLAQRRVERLLAAPCVPTSGSDSGNGVTVTWSSTVDHGMRRIEATTWRATPFGPHDERLWSGGSCW